MKVLLYARVSQPSSQDTEDKVSIDQQLADQRRLCERNGWQIEGEFVDNENYKATQTPKKGKSVNPSGERADRPQFLAMLEAVKIGEVDAVLCWRDDRLVRHPRVAVALEDALDIGDAQRNGRPKIEIRDATGAMIDRFTLSIKATIWREENKRRAERTKMGKIATLQQGRWPTCYPRFGYTTRKDGGRGRIIEIEEAEAAAVRKIHEMFDAGASIGEIRRYLIAENVPQKSGNGKHVWGQGLIYGILHAEDYTGIATFDFSDGTSYSVEIPEIVPRDLWERNQARIECNKALSPRNAGGVYLLQNILRCGECGVLMHVRRQLFSYVGGKKRPFSIPPHNYFCSTPFRYPEEQHPPKRTRYGPTLDWAVWRRVVDYGIKQPECIREQVLRRQTELQAQGDSVDGDIAHVHRRLAEVARERKSYHKQIARGKMSEREYDELVDETEDARRYWQSELARLQELRDNQAKVEAGLDYATELLTTLQAQLPEIDIPPDELRTLSEEKRNGILETRRGIIRALVDEVEVYASGEVKIHGLLDGSEASQFGLEGWSSRKDRV
jgi:DNA invertase Pin-like site-specific DNA recombinase